MGAWQEIVDYTVPSNTTSVVLDSFGTITKDDFVKVVFTHVNAVGGGVGSFLYPNNETTATDYHTQILVGTGSSVIAIRQNVLNFGNTQSGAGSSSLIAYIKLSENDRFNMFVNRNDRNDSSLETVFLYNTSSGATFTSGITSFTLNSNVTNGLGAGSRIQIYKLAAEKVADITVASNTTQVDISNLSIDKDSEYLLVSDINTSISLGSGHYLYINDNSTLTDYYSQGIIGNGSNAQAQRFNAPIYQITRTTGRNIYHSHIKLSNIGAYTSQSYGLEMSGTSTPEVRNYFISSTSEAITSITKLNIVSQVTNGITSGSRFTLYKLYE